MHTPWHRKYTTQLIKPHKHTHRDGYSSASQCYHSVLCLGNARGYRIRRTIKYVIINALIHIHECTFKITDTVNHDGLPLHLTQVVYEASLRHQTRTSISLKVIHKNKTKINSISSSISYRVGEVCRHVPGFARDTVCRGKMHVMRVRLLRC